MSKFDKKNFTPEMSESITPPTAGVPDLNSAIKNLIVSNDGSIEDKIATVKTAQIADQGRVEAAIKTLMKR